MPSKYGLHQLGHNALQSRQCSRQMVNSILQQNIYEFVTVYIDDVLICSRALEEHEKYIDQVLRRLQNNILHCRHKCDFQVLETE